MNRTILQTLSLLAVAALGACSSGGPQSYVPGGASAFVRQLGNGDAPFRTANAVRRLCPPALPGRMECFALVRTDLTPAANLEIQPDDRDVQPDELKDCSQKFSEGYCPIDLQQAYKLPSLTKGKLQTVAIVDAYGYKHAAADVAFYRKVMGLKKCETSTKCLRIVNQEGNSSPLPPEQSGSTGWRGEQGLDLDMVSAVCPNCKIILVEAANDYTNNLYAGIKTAGRLGAKYIGASWGGSEGGGNPIFHQPGHVIAAAAGDNGGGGPNGGPEQPCSFTYVVCVGGTHLERAMNKRGWFESAWNELAVNRCNGPCGATGSGCSRTIAKPAWQTDTLCKMRSEADISATASVLAGVLVYDSELDSGSCPTNCFFLFGGTSASTQIISAAYALAGNANLQAGASRVWKLHKGNMWDVTKGNNIDAKLGITCASKVSYICTARLGFDGPTGWGTPDGVDAL